MNTSGERIILGIDPGTNIMGYSIIVCQGKQFRLLVMDVLKLTHIKDPMTKLQEIFRTCCQLIDDNQVGELALEDPFYGKNVQSMLKLGRAQGMAIAAGLHKDLSVHQYSPRKIKQSITGKGSASKEQVAGMLQHTLKIESMPTRLDASDALAVAVCHFYQNGLPDTVSGGKPNSWQAFLSKNPGRVK